MVLSPTEGSLANCVAQWLKISGLRYYLSPIHLDSPKPNLQSQSMTDLDKVDKAMLAALQKDGRMSNARLAETVGLSETPCARRLKRLENDGYIDQYRAMLSRSALGLGVVAFVYVRFAVHDRAVATRFEHEVQAIARILSCHNVSGSADYLMQVVARDLDDYGAFVRDELRSLPGVTSVESSLSLREVKANGGLPLP